MSQFSRIILEISNLCSAKCPYCPTGLNNGRIPGSQEKFIPVERFEKIITVLCENSVFGPKSNKCVNLLNWGEPFLHPEFGHLCEILKEHGLNYAISTNASKVPKLSKSLVSNMLSCRISMSGFSQESYDKVHRLNIDKVKNNIEYLTQEIRKYNPDTVITIAYHVYQFNCRVEINEAAQFAKDLNIRFEPVSAAIGDFDATCDYLDGTLSQEMLLKYSSELFLGHFNYKPAKHCVMWDDYLVVDVTGDVILCCGVHYGHKAPKNGNTKMGNIIDDEFNFILNEKSKSRDGALCHKCLSNGMASCELPLWPQTNLHGIKSTGQDIPKRVDV